MEKWQQKLYFHGRLNSQITYIQCTTLHSEFSGAMNIPLQWCHNERNDVSNHQPHDCLLNRLFRHRWNKASKLRVTGFCVGNSPVTGEFPAQMASNAEKVSIWWRHHVEMKFRRVHRTSAWIVLAKMTSELNSTWPYYAKYPHCTLFYAIQSWS